MSTSQRVIALRRGFVPLTAALLWVMVSAEVASAQKLKVHNTYGSPIDTLKDTHLTTTVPDAKDFVRATTPNKDKLDYTPLTGTDPERPKPRDPKGIEALQAELEGAGAKNEVKARGMLPRKPVHKAQTAKASETAAAR